MLYYFNIIILSIFVSFSYADNDLAQLMLPSSDIDMNKEKEKKEEPKEVPVEEAPAEETPVEEAPAEETPVEEAPAEETPIEETPEEEEEETITINELGKDKDINWYGNTDPFKVGINLGIKPLNASNMKAQFKNPMYFGLFVETPYELFATNKFLSCKVGAKINFVNFPDNDSYDEEEMGLNSKVENFKSTSFIGTLTKKILFLDFIGGLGMTIFKDGDGNSDSGLTLSGGISLSLPVPIEKIDVKLSFNGAMIGDVWTDNIGWALTSGIIDYFDMGLVCTYDLSLN